MLRLDRGDLTGGGRLAEQRRNEKVGEAVEAAGERRAADVEEEGRLLRVGVRVIRAAVDGDELLEVALVGILEVTKYSDSRCKHLAVIQWHPTMISLLNKWC